MEFQDVVRQRYACKKFDGRSILEEKMTGPWGMRG